MLILLCSFLQVKGKHNIKNQLDKKKNINHKYEIESQNYEVEIMKRKVRTMKQNCKERQSYWIKSKS